MITIKNLKKTYDNVTPLKDVSVCIEKGDVISIIGPSGTGKSTFLRCINLLEQPDAGQILIDGTDLMDPQTDIRLMRRRIGMVFQSFNLFAHKMVIENVMMAPMDLLGIGKQEAFDAGVRYLKMVGLGEKLYAYPDELSGGQKQRVAIARCLAMQPEIILFDEPTSALDPTMVGEVQAVIRGLADQGLTMMIVSHDMDFSREIANRVFYMDEGTVYEDGTPEQIFFHPQREKTRAFIMRLKTMSYEIRSADFDLYRMNAEIEQFGGRHHLEKQQINNIELVIEELVLHNIIRYSQDILTEIGYFEADQRLELRFTYDKESYDPFNTEDEDVLSMLLVRQLTDHVRYTYDGVNHLSMVVAVQEE